MKESKNQVPNSAVISAYLTFDQSYRFSTVKLKSSNNNFKISQQSMLITIIHNILCSNSLVLDTCVGVYDNTQNIQQSKPCISRKFVAVILGSVIGLLVIAGLIAAVIVLVSDVTGEVLPTSYLPVDYSFINSTLYIYIYIYIYIYASMQQSLNMKITRF